MKAFSMLFFPSYSRSENRNKTNYPSRHRKKAQLRYTIDVMHWWKDIDKASFIRRRPGEHISWWRRKWKYFLRYWPFVRGIHQSPVKSPHKGQWRGALMFSLIYTWMDGWVNDREAGDLRRHRAHYDVTVMIANWVIIGLGNGLFPVRHHLDKYYLSINCTPMLKRNDFSNRSISILPFFVMKVDMNSSLGFS